MEVLGHSERLCEGFSADFISWDPVLIQIIAGRTSKIMSEDLCMCVKLCHVFCNYSEYRQEVRKRPLSLVITQENKTFPFKRTFML